MRTKVIVIVALALALSVGILSQVSAQSESVSISRVTIAPGAQGTVDLSALGIGSGGLGAWEIGIVYDPALVTPASCSAQEGGVCNLNFAANQVRVVGASASGLTGDTSLADITFECGTAEGTSALTPVVGVFADATQGGPLPIGPAVVAGSVTCTEAAGPGPQPTSPPPGDGPTDEPTADETPVVSLPATGSGPTGGGSAIVWFAVALAGAGVAGIAGIAALRPGRAARRR